MLQFSCIHQSHHGRLCPTPHELTFASNHPLQLHWENISSIDLVTKKLHGTPSRMLAIRADNNKVYTFHTFHDVDLAHQQLVRYFAKVSAEMMEGQRRRGSGAGADDHHQVIAQGSSSSSSPLHSKDGQQARARRSVSTAPSAAAGVIASPQSSSSSGQQQDQAASSSPFGWQDVFKSKRLASVAIFFAFLAVVFVASTVDLMWSATTAIVQRLSSSSSSSSSSSTSAAAAPADSSIFSTGSDTDAVQRIITRSGIRRDSVAGEATPSFLAARFGRDDDEGSSFHYFPPASFLQREQLDDADPGMSALLAIRPAAAVEALRWIEAQLFWTRALFGLGCVLLATVLYLGG